MRVCLCDTLDTDGQVTLPQVPETISTLEIVLSKDTMMERHSRCTNNSDVGNGFFKVVKKYYYEWDTHDFPKTKHTKFDRLIIVSVTIFCDVRQLVSFFAMTDYVWVIHVAWWELTFNSVGGAIN